MNRRIAHKGAWISRLALQSAVALTACDSPLPTENQPEPLPMLATAIVSNPVAATASAGVAPGLALGGTAAPEVVYVSLPPWTILYASEATVHNLRTGSEVIVPMRAGGFDPVAVTAVAGDTLELDFRLTTGDDPLRYAIVVPPTRPPVVVRTDPPPQKRDVPLNAAMLVVFSEPVDPRTITPQSVQLLTDGAPGAGAVTVDADGLRVEFQPDHPLAPGTEYQLVITTGVTDLTGDPLAQGVTVAFTTQRCRGTPNSIPVVTVSVAAGCSAPDVVASAEEAVSLVEPGGVIQFVSGGALPFSIIDEIAVTKPITFRSADAGSPVIEVGLGRGFVVNAVPAGTVTFSGLTFVTRGDSTTFDVYSAVYAAGTYDQVVVENSTFLVGGLAGVFGGTSSVPGAKVTVRRNAFSFPMRSSDVVPEDGSPSVLGYMAVFGAGTSGTIDILDNVVAGPTQWGAFQLQQGVSGRIENNTATQCGRMGCIRAIGGPGAVVVGNTVSSAPGLGAQRGITVRSDGAVVTGNIVNGGFTGGDPTDPASYGYSAGGIQISGGTNATVTGNIISGAVLGLEGNTTIQSLQDNLITRVITAFSGTFGTVPLTRNDVTDYVTPFTVTFGSGGLVCNWWGSLSGPASIPAGASAAIYTPWATAPIARGAGGVCDGT